jgi:O-antigen/teichoic acid export membrane protein
MSFRAPLVRSTLGLSFARLLSGGLLVLATIVLARKAGAEELGWFGLALTIAVYASVLADAGISQYLLPTLGRSPRSEWPSIWADCIRFELRSTVPFALAYAAVVAVAAHGGGRLALFAVLPWWLLIRVNGAARSVFTVAEQVGAEATATIAEAVVSLIVLVVVVSFYPSAWAAALCLSSGAAVGLGIRLNGLRRLGVTGGKAMTSARALARTAVHFNGYTVLTTFYLRIDVVFLALLATPLALGLYQPPVRFATALIILPDALASLLLGRAARRPHAEDVRIRQEQLLAIGLPIGCVLVLVAALAGGPLLAWLYGPTFRQSWLALTLLTATVPLSMLASMNGNVLTARGLQRTRVTRLGLTSCLAVAAGIPAIWLWSYNGAAAVSVLNEVLLAGSYAAAVWLAAGRKAILLPRPHGLRLAV